MRDMTKLEVPEALEIGSLVSKYEGDLRYMHRYYGRTSIHGYIILENVYTGILSQLTEVDFKNQLEQGYFRIESPTDTRKWYYNK